MTLSNWQLERFMILWTTATGEAISRDAARQNALRLLHLYRVLIRQPPGNRSIGPAVPHSTVVLSIYQLLNPFDVRQNRHQRLITIREHCSNVVYEPARSAKGRGVALVETMLADVSLRLNGTAATRLLSNAKSIAHRGMAAAGKGRHDHREGNSSCALAHWNP